MFLEVLRFIFSNFWIWLGSFLIIAEIASMPAQIVRAILYYKQNDKKSTTEAKIVEE